MQLLLTLTEHDIDSSVTNLDPSNFRRRQAARAVVLDEQDRVALLWVGLHEYHKLPGGGVKEGEDIQQALGRELLEEIGCEAEIICEVGKTDERRDSFQMCQVSYCYLARQRGEKGTPSFTESELRDGFKMVWAQNMDDAINLLSDDKPNSLDGKFKSFRDLELLKAAKRQINLSASLTM